MQINSMSLCGVTPEELAQMLTEENPKLVSSCFFCQCFAVVFHPVIQGPQFSRGFAKVNFLKLGKKKPRVVGFISIETMSPALQLKLSQSCVHFPQTVYSMKDHLKAPVQADDVFYPVSKESTILSFSMEMRKRDEDMEESEVRQGSMSRENERVKEGSCNADEGENGEGADLVIVAMKKTSISVVRGRGCTDTGCTVNEVVLVAQSSKVMLGEYGFDLFFVNFLY